MAECGVQGSSVRSASASCAVACEYVLRGHTAMRDFQASIYDLQDLGSDDSIDASLDGVRLNSGNGRNEIKHQQGLEDELDRSRVVKDVNVYNRTGMRARCRLLRPRGIEDEKVVLNAAQEYFASTGSDNDSIDSSDEGAGSDDEDQEELCRGQHCFLHVSLGHNDIWKCKQPIPLAHAGRFAVFFQRDVDEDETLDNNAPEKEPFHTCMVADIQCMDDGSILVTLQSQLQVENLLQQPLMLWAFSSFNDGVVYEWVMDQEQECCLPLPLVHPVASLSARPSSDTEFAPVITSLDDLNKRIMKVKNHAELTSVWIGDCVCKMVHSGAVDNQTDDSMDVQSPSTKISTVSLHRDLPAWRCRIEVESFPLQATQTATYEELPSRRKHRKAKEKLDIATDGTGQPLFLYRVALRPYMMLHNRLATPLSYRLLDERLQLLAEGVLMVGSSLPVFQVDPLSTLRFSLRLENYHWSSPSVLLHHKRSSSSLPFKASMETIELKGRHFETIDPTAWEQRSIPNLQLQIRLRDFDVEISAPVWIVNRAGLDLEYSGTNSSKQPTYIHKQASLSIQETRRLSNSSYLDEDSARVHAFDVEQHTKVAETNPIAVAVCVHKARNLYKAHFFGSQSPYVRASLYVLQSKKQKSEGNKMASMVLVDSATTKPSRNGGTNPAWSSCDNALLLRIPQETEDISRARVILEVRTSRYGIDSCLGATAVRLDSITRNSLNAAAQNWYQLTKRAKKKKDEKKPTRVHRGDLCVSFALGLKHDFLEKHNIATDATSLDPARKDSSSGFEANFDAAFGDDDDDVFMSPQECLDRSIDVDSDASESSCSMRSMTVYLPQNRLSNVTIAIRPDNTFAQLFELVCTKASLTGDYQVEEFEFYELQVARFDSQRSPGRPDIERWYGRHLGMHTSVGNGGADFGVCLCHRSAMSTLRLYDEQSNPLTHHVISKSFLATSKQANPAQHKPMLWSEILLFGLTPNLNLLRVRAQDGEWSNAIRLKHQKNNQVHLCCISHRVPTTVANSSRVGSLELAILLSTGIGVYESTLTVTIVPRFRILNGLPYTIHIRQVEAENHHVLAPHESCAFHWGDVNLPKLAELMVPSQCGWSEPFKVDSEVSSTIRLRSIQDPTFLRNGIRVGVEKQNGLVTLVFNEANSF